MRAIVGTVAVVIFISIFGLLFIEFTKEAANTRSIHTVLDESIDANDIHLSTNSYISDKNGSVVYEVYGAENRIELNYDDIPSYVKDAFLATEDRLFFDHPGFDITGISRAFLVNMQSDGVEQGGSTITQQLARNAFLTHSQSYERKISELLHAYQLERTLTKEDILAKYINTIYFANGVYGIEAAAEYYFGKSSSELTYAETAFLASIPNNPSHYNPLEHQERTDERKKWVLSRMLEEDVIDEDDYQASLEETIELTDTSRREEYPDYVAYVYHELKELIAEEERYSDPEQTGAENEGNGEEDPLQARTNEVLAEGVTIETGLDPALQDHAQRQLNQELSGSDIQGAVSIIDHRNHSIAAITGGTDYQLFDYHRGYQSFRQPGSAIKPLLVFAPYLNETNQTPESLINAGPFERNGYEPENFGGNEYGKVTMTEAFTQSYNTAAVRMMDQTGVEESFAYIEPFQFKQLNDSDYRLPAALGGFTHGVSVNELTAAYTVFAADGMYQEPRAIQRVKDHNGDVLYEWNESAEDIFEKQTAEQIRTMLSGVISEGTGREAGFDTSGFLGGKTGTTNEFYDLWFVGSDDDYTAGLWVGKDSPESLMDESSSHLHTRLWRQIMNR
ncbi:transglycosylase domain-containing protein [Salisediminibacterium halotolerans]|uniref:transglycosylase domain-containing protein n=1 Tax=Salisediminibacterium halotolerans TaxID=517425 RepID=UPI000EB52BEC|nr:transglycosylase domain-containing protein [Salisediminibacterium halotolerans]RLJ72327.1 penicillin-binding protein 1A [Actinophytocola xinjiangensis]RPE85541.1 penicillin-binding protein 1A [Salisediminibacterium halotolerans]TWG33496.1 penicillin-binding protein 1A [Salisediminibacterium halotolerans]GEL08943.1 penicillin-binding protein 4 [Salisediminibacterium halotolerans]